MKEELLKKLNQIVDNGKKKSTLETETEIGLPANSLSALLAGHKEMPDKWEAKIEGYLKENTVPAIEPKTELVVDKVGELKVKPSKEVLKVMSEAMDKINKDFGKGTIMMFGDKGDSFG